MATDGTGGSDAGGSDMGGSGIGGRGPIGPAGLPFPSESEWLDLPAPAEQPPIRADFVERTLQALAGGGADAPEPLLTADRLRAFAAPEPSPGFVDDTLLALRRDRKQRWRELLTRHIAPEPSPEFVARTLAALAADPEVAAQVDAARDRHRPHRWRRSAWPLLAVAAAAALWLLLRTPSRAPIELRLAQQEPAAFAHAHAASPLAAVLEAHRRAEDPYALGEGGPDGTWLLLEGGR